MQTFCWPNWKRSIYISFAANLQGHSLTYVNHILHDLIKMNVATQGLDEGSNLTYIDIVTKLKETAGILRDV